MISYHYAPLTPLNAIVIVAECTVLLYTLVMITLALRGAYRANKELRADAARTQRNARAATAQTPTAPPLTAPKGSPDHVDVVTIPGPSRYNPLSIPITSYGDRTHDIDVLEDTVDASVLNAAKLTAQLEKAQKLAYSRLVAMRKLKNGQIPIKTSENVPEPQITPTRKAWSRNG